jgi:hypothetical protein
MFKGVFVGVLELQADFCHLVLEGSRVATYLATADHMLAKCLQILELLFRLAVHVHQEVSVC